MISRLRAALSTFDFDQLAWVADGFAAEKYVESPAALLELLSTLEKSKSSDLDSAFKVCAGQGPFECFALACLARHAGIGTNVILDGVVKRPPLAVAGDLTVNGPLICNSDNWLLVAGNFKAEALISSADIIVSGNMVVRDGVIGLNSWSQSMWVHDRLDTPTFITKDYAAEIGEGPEEVELSDESVDDLLAPGLADVLREWQSDGGPDKAVDGLLKHLKKPASIFAKTKDKRR